MEDILRFLPSRPQPGWVRFSASAALVIVSFALSLEAESTLGQYPFILFIPAILLASMMYDRGSGFFASFLSALLVAGRLDWSVNLTGHISALTVFGLVASSVVLVAEGMRKALERKLAVQQELESLLEEQGHRIKNNFAIASSLLALQARSQKDNPEVRSALDSAVERLRVLAESHDHLRFKSHEHSVDMQEYLSEICWKLAETHRGIRPVAVDVKIERIYMRTGQAHRIGIIVNELVTNALKYAFPEEMSGTITVEFSRTSDGLKLIVEDDGAGCPENTKEGLGSRLIRLFVQQLKGTMTRAPMLKGCRVTIDIPQSR
jgi:two-component sensor histidine kinase